MAGLREKFRRVWERVEGVSGWLDPGVDVGIGLEVVEAVARRRSGESRIRRILGEPEEVDEEEVRWVIADSMVCFRFVRVGEVRLNSGSVGCELGGAVVVDVEETGKGAGALIAAGEPFGGGPRGFMGRGPRAGSGVIVCPGILLDIDGAAVGSGV